MATEREGDQLSVTVIPDPACAQGLKATWGLGKQMFVFAGMHHKVQEEMRGNLESPTYIHQVKWDTEMHEPITRKLVNESRNIFMLLQHKVTECSGAALKPHLVKASRQYRAVLKACSINLHTAAGSTFNEEERERLERQVQIYEMIELIWSLCEMLFIEVSPGGVILTQLLEWLRWNFCEAETQALEVMQYDPPENHKEYWDTIYRFVLQGRVDNARKLLSLHSQIGEDSFQSLDELLKKLPLQAILCGDEDIFSELKDLCETWYHMLVSKMLYQNPTVKASDLQYYVHGCINEYAARGRLGELDNILIAALEFDIHQVIKDCSSVLGSWWFVVHLTDLFHHSGGLEAQKQGYGSNLREFLLLEYASGLMSHNSLWQIGIDYFDHCPEFGRSYLELYLEHIPLDTEKKAWKILRICEAREMNHQVRSICRSMGMKALHNGRLGSALSWCLRSKDVAFATMITEKFLTEYTDKGDFSNLDLIDKLGPSMLLSKRLTFLGKYREFHKLYEDGDIYAAAELLLSLLTARLTPRQFLLTLLTDALPMLEYEEVIFTSHQTYELMYCLESITLSKTQDDHKPPKGESQSGAQVKKGLSETEKEKIELMRLALARNLARAILKEGTLKA
ncbi:nuclear pore complex protein Nup85-like isoform X2 [Liolophura sinensis]|uniref:nuclear pore complex protein Nup85-like isoform X2 n=1 Tax=Liolophura sinensis TaxID=3198878 RepID=UPI003158B58C